MRCKRCYSNDCVHAIASQQNLSAQQQIPDFDQQVAAYLKHKASKGMSEELIKSYNTPKKNKKLLLIRK